MEYCSVIQTLLNLNWVPLRVRQKPYRNVFPHWYALGHRYFNAHWVLGTIVLFYWVCWRQTSKPLAIFRHLHYHNGINRSTTTVQCDVQPMYRKRQNCHCLWHTFHLSCLQKHAEMWTGDTVPTGFFKVRRKEFTLPFRFRLSKCISGWLKWRMWR